MMRVISNAATDPQNPSVPVGGRHPWIRGVGVLMLSLLLLWGGRTLDAAPATGFGQDQPHAGSAAEGGKPLADHTLNDLSNLTLGELMEMAITQFRGALSTLDGVGRDTLEEFEKARPQIMQRWLSAQQILDRAITTLENKLAEGSSALQPGLDRFSETLARGALASLKSMKQDLAVALEKLKKELEQEQQRLEQEQRRRQLEQPDESTGRSI